MVQTCNSIIEGQEKVQSHLTMRAEQLNLQASLFRKVPQSQVKTGHQRRWWQKIKLCCCHGNDVSQSDDNYHSNAI